MNMYDFHNVYTYIFLVIMVMRWKICCTLKRNSKSLHLFTTILNHAPQSLTPHLRLINPTRVLTTIWCISPIFAMQLVHTTFALRSSYEQRFACDYACGPWACILVGVTIYRRHRIGLEVTLLDQFDSNDM